jgi:hypothetical protein
MDLCRTSGTSSTRDNSLWKVDSFSSKQGREYMSAECISEANCSTTFCRRSATCGWHVSLSDTYLWCNCNRDTVRLHVSLLVPKWGACSPLYSLRNRSYLQKQNIFHCVLLQNTSRLLRQYHRFHWQVIGTLAKGLAAVTSSSVPDVQKARKNHTSPVYQRIPSPFCSLSLSRYLCLLNAPLFGWYFYTILSIGTAFVRVCLWAAWMEESWIGAMKGSKPNWTLAKEGVVESS